jgi:hypothetical protein
MAVKVQSFSVHSNQLAETGAPGSKTHRHNGLYYVALDDHGNRISPPIMASQLPCRPTQNKLDKRYGKAGSNGKSCWSASKPASA